MKINRNFDKLVPSYLFAEIASRTAAFVKAHPDNRLIRMGIGDVTLPLPPIAVEALRRGADELGVKETFKGYPEYEGYDFVREAVAGYYKGFGVTVAADEVFISDGAKSDTGNIGDIFGADNTVLVTDPVYPVYVDANIMAGRKIVYAPCHKENDFLAMPDKSLSPDMIYLCSPNNPTGAAYSAEQLRAWVDYANEHDAVILYDAAYEAFITDGSPRSIFAIEGARTCAIEFCSLSKTAGFTGTRCGYTVIPKELVRDGHSLRDLWYRRQATKFNGVSYPVQCAAAAVFSEEGLRQVHENLAYYQENARVISAALDEMGIYYTGGKNSPYIWLECPNGLGSWEFFDLLLNEAQVVGTPGEGFGAQGKGYLRLTSFNSRENTVEAVQRIKKLLSSSV